MSDPTTTMQTLAARWNTGLAEQCVRKITTSFWTAGTDRQALLSTAEQMRQIIRQQLGQSSAPVEQIRLLDISYRLEQGVGRRDVALSLAKNLRHLAERKTDAPHQVRAGFLLADAWYMVSALSFSVDWSKRAFGEAKPLEQKGQGGRPFRLLYANEEVNLSSRLSLRGGMYDQAVRLLVDAIRRYDAINETAGKAAAIGALAQIHMLHGRWADALDAARQARQVSQPLPEELADVDGLWVGARAACHLGDLATAEAWTHDAMESASRTNNIPALALALSTKAFFFLTSGEKDQALHLADRAVRTADTWQHEILRRRVMLDRAWVRLANNQADVDEARALVEAFTACDAGLFQAEAQYALYHALRITGQDAQAAYDTALEQFSRLNLDWHIAQARANQLLPGDQP